jgi:hypothetical protein
MPYLNTLTSYSTPIQLGIVKPTLVSHGLTYGLRNHSMCVVVTGATAGWSDDIVFYGWVNEEWVELASEATTINAAGDATVVWSPLHMIGFARVCAVAATNPGAGAEYYIVTDPRKEP